MPMSETSTTPPPGGRHMTTHANNFRKENDHSEYNILQQRFCIVFFATQPFCCLVWLGKPPDTIFRCVGAPRASEWIRPVLITGANR